MAVMEPWREVNRSVAATAADLATEEAYLAAVRAAYPGWEIREVFGGFLAVPAGTTVVQSTTPGGLAGKLERMAARDHEPEPGLDTAVTIGGPRHLKPFDERFTHNCWPAEGLCKCGLIVRRESKEDGWEHTMRRPGELG